MSDLAKEDTGVSHARAETGQSATEDRKGLHSDPQRYSGRGLPCLLGCQTQLPDGQSRSTERRGNASTVGKSPETRSTTSSIGCSTKPSNAQAPQRNRAKFKYSGHGVQGRNARLNKQPRQGKDLNTSFSGGQGQKATAVDSRWFVPFPLSSSGRRRSDSDQCKHETLRTTVAQKQNSGHEVAA